MVSICEKLIRKTQPIVSMKVEAVGFGLPIAFFESEEGKREYEEWLEQKKKSEETK